jgi:hypothetical protein
VGRRGNRLLGPLLGLPELPYVEFPPSPFPAALKVPAIDRHLGGRPAVWIDDLIGPEAREWAAARSAPTLLLEVDPAVGLRRDDVDRAVRWAAAQ